MDENQPTEEKVAEEPVAEKVAEENDKADSEPEAEVKGRVPDNKKLTKKLFLWNDYSKTNI